jgi:hypothetical protein
MSESNIRSQSALEVVKNLPIKIFLFKDRKGPISNKTVDILLGFLIPNNATEAAKADSTYP